MIISTLIDFIIYIKKQLKEHKMPKNNKVTVISYNTPSADCACGWTHNTERTCDAKRALIRHLKFCVIGQQSNLIFNRENVIHHTKYDK